jgi:hypothetical protein
VKHGGAAPQVRARAEFRLWRGRLWAQIGLKLAIRLRALEARRRADPEGVQAETLAWLCDAGDRLAEFRAVNGRQPRTAAERSLIVYG